MTHPFVQNIDQLLSSIPSNVTVVLATKYADVQGLQVISASFPDLIFGENRVQSGEEKQRALNTLSNPWHFIGHLQRNKIKKVVGAYACIQSVDSVKLLHEIQGHAQKIEQHVSVLLQINPLNDPDKFGFSAEDAFLQAGWNNEVFSHIHVKGLMCMAPHTHDVMTIKKTFKKTRQLYDKMIQNGWTFNWLSMGMSHDYQIAVDEGSTMIRIGSKVFG